MRWRDWRRMLPTTGRFPPQARPWPDVQVGMAKNYEKLTSRHYRYMSPKKIEKVNYISLFW
jgi:hypothetical protein